MKRGLRTALQVLAVIACVYIVVFVDLTLRAKGAYLEGEKYYNRHHNPSEKKTACLQEYGEAKKNLDEALSSGKITREQYRSRLELAEFELNHHLKDSSIKHAYIWYKTAAELFAPPESKWARLSREKMPKARRLWKAELEKKGISFQDYMLD